MKALFYFLIIISAVALTVAFTVLNPGDVPINLYFARFNLPLAATVIMSLFFGVLVGFLVSLVGVVSKARKIRRLNKELKNARTEITYLRKLPIEEP